MKPILFNTEMVRAILDNRKTMTRRIVKHNPCECESKKLNGVCKLCDDKGGFFWPDEYVKQRCPYRPGDILYVRETCNRVKKPNDSEWHYEYKASCANPKYFSDGFTAVWRPSIHMPREAARIFLRLTNVKVQRVQDITEEEARKEGCESREDFLRVWNDCYAKPQPVKVNGVIDHYVSYPWEDIMETKTYRGMPWYVIGNPWVWVIEFERCEKPTEGQT